MSDPELVSRFRRARTDPALAVLEGFHALKHARRFGATIDIAVTSDAPGLRALAMQLAPDVVSAIDHTVGTVTADVFALLSPTPPETHVIAIARRRHDVLADALVGTAPTVLLESPAHSGNIGAVVRVAAAVGAASVFTTGTVDPWNPGALRGAAGLHFALPVLRAGIDDMPRARLIAIDPDGESLADAPFPDDAILAFGSERRGLSTELLERCATRVRIPMNPGVSSLNLATSVAAVLYRWKLSP